MPVTFTLILPVLLDFLSLLTPAGLPCFAGQITALDPSYETDEPGTLRRTHYEKLANLRKSSLRLLFLEGLLVCSLFDYVNSLIFFLLHRLVPVRYSVHDERQGARQHSGSVQAQDCGHCALPLPLRHQAPAYHLKVGRLLRSHHRA